jgi:SAM-dependent methyltransferase
MADRGAWDEQAANWIRWTRTPGHDVFDAYWPAFVAEILPSANGQTLEVGCGEGRVARALAEAGHDVVALDAAPALVRAARDDDMHARYVVADATALPVRDGAFGTVVAYNSLQAMAAFDDMVRAVREAARALTRGGSFCACVAHPMTDIGRMAASRGGETVLTGSYFERERVDETVRADGLEMTFTGWTYTLEDYARAFEYAGMVVERVREPLPAGQAGARVERWRRMPLFLFLRGVKA